MEDTVEKHILQKLSEYRKKRKTTAYLGICSPILFSLGFLFEQLSPALSRIVFIAAAFIFIFWVVRVNINCYRKCPRCGAKYCMKGIAIWCWTRRCFHCGLSIDAEEKSQLWKILINLGIQGRVGARAQPRLPSSNRTCGFPAYGFPMFFIVRLTPFSILRKLEFYTNTTCCKENLSSGVKP